MSYLWSRLSLLGFTATATIHISRFTLQICFPLYNLHQSTHCFFFIVFHGLNDNASTTWPSLAPDVIAAFLESYQLPPTSLPPPAPASVFKNCTKAGHFSFRHFYNSLKEVIKRSFYGQANRKRGKGGWRWAPSALTISKCENFDPFWHWDLILWYSKHISSHCEGSKKCIFHALFVVVNNI